MLVVVRFAFVYLQSFIPPLTPPPPFAVCAPLFVSVTLVGIAYAGLSLILAFIQLCLFHKGQVNQDRVWILAVIVVSGMLLPDHIYYRMYWMWVVSFVVQMADAETYILFILLQIII